MTNHWKYSFLITLIISLMVFMPSVGFSQNSQEEILVLDFFESLYQYNFNESELKLAQVKKELNGRPEAYISTANYYWWLMMTGKEDKQSAMSFEESNLAVINRYSKDQPKQLSPDELFAIIHGYAYQTRLALHKKKYLKGLSNLKRILPYLEEVLENSRENDKFTLLAGLYHYLASVTIEKRPILRPFFKLAPDCDRKLGYQLLISAAQSSHPLISNEAKYFLMKINLEISGNFFEANKWSRILVEHFPDNILYHYYLMLSMAELKRNKEVQKEFIRIQDLSANTPWLSPEQRHHFVNEAAHLAKKTK